MFHRLDWTGLIPGRALESFRQCLDLIEVGMPHGYFGGEVLKDTVAVSVDRKISPLALGALISLTRLEPLHQIDGRIMGERNLLVAATNAEYRLRGLLDYFKNTGQRACSVLIPG